MKLEIAKVLIVSTAHMPTPEFLDGYSMMGGEEGYLIWVPKEGLPCAWGVDDETLPEYAGLVKVLRTAREKGCRYVMFDRDAEPLDRAPTYPWAEA